MRTLYSFLALTWFCTFTCFYSSSARADSIPWSQLGAKAEAQYHGDGLAITATPDGARLQCAFQKLAAQATPTGLWLDSTAGNSTVGNHTGHFQVVAQALGRPEALQPLAESGTVLTEDKLVRLVRPQVTEEYSVSVDGVQQDFVIAAKPAGTGKLQLALAVSGARAENSAQGVQLVLDGSSRKIAYGKLQATDATGRSLPATLRATADHRLMVTVADAQAVYPVRIDPTFSDANWITINTIPGVNGSGVYSMASDGAGNVYVSGGFTMVQGLPVSYIAEWNGTSWSALGGGLNTYASVLAVSGTNLYAGGTFTYATNSGTGVSVSRVAQWNGTSWSAMSGGLNGPALALAVFGTNVCAGGNFTDATNSGTHVAVSYVAQWNGTSWSAVGGGLNNSVDGLAVSGTNLYVGGGFSYATNSGVGISASDVAQWNGNTWSAVGGGLNSLVRALVVSGTNVYAAGNFTYATNSGTGTLVNHIAQWNGSTWSEVGGGLNGVVFSLACAGTNLYVGAEGGGYGFTIAGGGTNVQNVALWNGSTWSAMNDGISIYGGESQDDVNTIVISGTNVLVGCDGIAPFLSEWNGSSWFYFGNGLNNSVSALAIGSNDVLYAGGAFTGAFINVPNYIAQWTGTGWLPVGGGVNGSVDAVAVLGTNVYIGGSFSHATNSGVAISASDIAEWNGSTWSAVGGGVNSTVYALAVSGNNIYAGGGFSYATNSGVGSSASEIAEWNGSTWSGVGSGVNSTVYALAVSGANVYAGGQFSTAGGNTASDIAQWNGSIWSAVGTGLNNTVRALAVSGSDVYAGGQFSTAGGNPASEIALWNGSTWSGMGGGVNGTVYAVAVSGTNVCVGGSFSYATNSGVGISSRDLAVWNGSTWSPLGSGVNNTVNALLVSPDQSTLDIGGAFTQAGVNTDSPYAVAYLIQPPPTVITSTNAAGGTYGSAFTYTITASGSPTSFGASGLPSGLSVSPSSGVISGSPSQSGYYTPVISATNAGGYGIATLNLTVTQANLTVSGLLASNKVYDGTTTATLNFSGAALQGLAFSDPVTLSQTGYTATFSGPDVGNNLAVTVSSLPLSGTKATNYALTLPTGLTANITPAPATVTLNPSEQAYDGTAKSVSATTTPASLPVSLTYNGSSTDPAAAGAYTVVATVTNPDYSGSATNSLYIVGAPQISAATTVTNLAAQTLFTFTWTAVPGANYQVLYVPDLTQTWLDLNGPVTATNSTMVTTDPMLAPPTNRLYRVQAVLQ